MNSHIEKVVFKSVNSKPLVNSVHEYIADHINSSLIDWNSDLHVETITAIIEEYLFTLIDDNKITRYKIICDSRNNSNKNKQLGIFNLEVQFNQYNCVNVTKILYTINMPSSTQKNIRKY